MSTRVLIGLGSNLDEPTRQVQQAIKELEAIPSSRLLQVSSLYRSPPMGPADQPDYINAVAEMDTSLSAHALLDALQAIENAHDRVRQERWGPRTLDLDILLYSDEQINDERLQVPHPGILERAFVLYPLAEILPGCVIPGAGQVSELLAACPADGLERISTGS